MARVIVVLDVAEIDRLGHARPMVELAQIAAQRLVVPDLPQVALEVAEIDRVEADEGGEEPPVGFRQPLAAEVALAGEPRLEPVERLEQGAERLFVCLLRGGEARAIDAVVDGRVDAAVQGVDLASSSAG